MADDIFTKPLVYSVPGMDAVEVRRDLTYRRLADGSELQMDVYLPPGLAAGKGRPGALFVHGGPVPTEAWPAVKNWGVFTSYGRLLAAEGMVGVTFNHRYLQTNHIEDPAANIEQAFVYLRERASSFHLDPDRLAVWCFSGGGPFLGPLLTEKPTWARCLVGYYTILDLRPLRERIPGGLSDEVLKRFSPVACLPESDFDGPPILIARAGRDQPRLNATIDAFAARALSANAMLDVLNHPRGQHGFDILDDDERSREILAHTIAFVKAHV